MPKQFHEKDSFRHGIHQVLNKVSPKMRITLEAVNELNLILHTLAAKIAHDASLLANNSQGVTISYEHIRSSSKLTLPGELANYSERVIVNADRNFTSNGSGTKTAPIRMKTRADLSFNPSALDRVIRLNSQVNRVSENATVALAAVISYICEELLNLASEAAISAKRNTITTKMIGLAINSDSELKMLMDRLNIVLSGSTRKL